MTVEHKLVRIPEERIPYKDDDTTNPVCITGPFRHYKVKIDRKIFSKKMKFFVEKINTIPSSNDDIFSFASKIAKKHVYEASFAGNSFISKIVSFVQAIWRFIRPNPGATPFDINELGRAPFWIVIELDEDINWEFTPGSRGVSSKYIYHGENYGLHYAYNNIGVRGPLYDEVASKPLLQPEDKFEYVPDFSASPNPERCRVVFWAVSSRAAGLKREFNFYVDFYQEDDQGNYRVLPTVFDPNVPNSGGTGIPG